MNKKELYFDLPEQLIASKPSLKRGGDRLLVVNRSDQTISHQKFGSIAQFLPPNALLVFNDSKVRKSRLYGTKIATGAKIELLLIKKEADNRWLCVVSKAKRQKIGDNYDLGAGVTASITAQYDDGLKQVTFQNLTENFIEKYGHIPLPPYIKREDSALDDERYQTVYANKIGSSAAPTAGLHFTEELLTELKNRGFDEVFVTLHVGLGTFAPIRVEELAEHQMHTESYEISAEAASKINLARQAGRPIVAVGTTSLRVLESAVTADGTLKEGSAETDIFIYGAYKFKVVDALFTNFHTPESTLLALVQAFAGKNFIMQAYKEAIEQQYQFFSYGDCMLIK